MAKHLLLTIILNLACHHIVFCQTFRQDIESIAYIDFPSRPKVDDTLDSKSYHYLTETERYYVVAIPVDKISANNVKKNGLSDFYNVLIADYVNAMHGKLITTTNFEVSGLKGVEIQYTSTQVHESLDLRFERFVFTSKKLFMYSFWTSSVNESKTASSRETFLNSMYFLTSLFGLKQDTEE